MQIALPALARAGYRIGIVAPDQGMEPAPLVGMPDDVELAIGIWEYPGAGRLAAWLAARPGLLARLLRLYSSALVRKPGFAARQLAVTACTIRAAERLVAGERPALFHAFDWPWSYGLAAVLLAHRAGARSMISTFGDVLPHEAELEQIDSFSKPFLRPSRAALESADVVTSMTEHCRGLVRHVGLSPSDVALVRIIGDMAPFHPEVDGEAIRARHVDDGGPLLLFVGQVRPRKGPQILIEALPAILDRPPDARVVLVGPDHDFVADLQCSAEALGVANAVDFVGAVSDEELPAYYAAADLFVFPTTTAIECLGLTFVQAMFAGVPVVATLIAGAPEVIRDGVDGRLVEAGNAEALARGILDVLGLSDDERRALARRARTRAEDLFRMQDVLGELLGTYDNLLGKPAGHPRSHRP
jgi:glycosyltransferase involved in cell wall biosynthesis